MARERVMRVDDTSTSLEWLDVTCLDICGCRKNALLERKWLPVGSPLDTIVTIFRPDGSHFRTFTPWKPSRC